MENSSFQDMSSITFIYQSPDVLQTGPSLLIHRECHWFCLQRIWPIMIKSALGAGGTLWLMPAGCCCDTQQHREGTSGYKTSGQCLGCTNKRCFVAGIMEMQYSLGSRAQRAFGACVVPPEKGMCDHCTLELWHSSRSCILFAFLSISEH